MPRKSVRNSLSNLHDEEEQKFKDPIYFQCSLRKPSHKIVFTTRRETQRNLEIDGIVMGEKEGGDIYWY